MFDKFIQYCIHENSKKNSVLDCRKYSKFNKFIYDIDSLIKYLHFIQTSVMPETTNNIDYLQNLMRQRSFLKLHP